MNKKLYVLYTSVILILISSALKAEECAVLFPDGVSNAGSSNGRTTISWNSRVTNSPDNILDTRNFVDNSGGTSCDTQRCSSSNSVAPDENYNSFPNVSTDISLRYQQTATATPGNYDDLFLNTRAVLTMAPGEYTFRDDVSLGYQSEIIVSGPGTVILYVRDKVTINTEAVINRASGDRNVLIYARDDIQIRSDATVNALLYTRDDISLSNGAEVTGAISARDRVSLNSASTVNYDSDMVQEGDFEPFCSQSLDTIIIQEETSGFCNVDGSIDRNHGGYTGSGFANPGFGTDITTEWSIDGDAGSYTLNWRYALGSSSRPGDLYVNDVFMGTVAFDRTGSWSVWGESSISLSLSAGVKRIRLQATVGSGLANLDYMEFAGPNASVASCEAGPALSRFDIDVGGSASVCSAQTISITAIGTDNDVLESYIGSINISTSTDNGTWSTTGVSGDTYGSLSNITSDGGSATYGFEALGEDLGQVTLNLSNTHAESLRITVNDPGEGVSSTSSSLTFSENAFLVETTDSLGEDVIAGRPHQFMVSLVGRDVDDPNYPDTDCGVLTEYNESAVKAWITRSSADPNGTNPQLNNSDESDVITLQNNEAAATDLLNMNFVSGVANVSLETTDVGQYSIEFLDDNAAFSQSEIRGGSETITVRPFGLLVSVDGNPAATNHLGSIFQAAGENFTVNVQAKAWHVDNDTDDDGVADFYNDVSSSNNADFLGSDILSFGQEIPAETVLLEATQIDPSISSDQVLQGDRTFSSFSSGGGSTSAVYIDDIGIYELQASISTPYLNASSAATEKANSASIEIGRFVPSYYSVSQQSLTPACEASDFSYLSQPFGLEFTIQAHSSRTTVTESYEGDYAKLVSLNAADLGGADEGVPTNLSSRLSMNEYTLIWSEGVSAIDSDVSIDRVSGTDGPFTSVELGTTFIDSDDVSIRISDLNLDTDGDTDMDLVGLGSTNLYFGRVVLPNIHGPESSPLVASFYTEYWDGVAWVQMINDNCTAVSQSDISFPDGSIDIVSNRSVSLGSGTTAASFLDTSSGAINFVGGDAGLEFSAPGATNTGQFSIDVDLSSYPWLRFDWDQNGSHDDSALPTAEISFGSYRGHDRIIFWQEVLN